MYQTFRNFIFSSPLVTFITHTVQRDCFGLYDLIFTLLPATWVLLEKLTASQLVKKLPWRFTAMLTRASYRSLYWARCIQATTFHPISLRSFLILSYHLHLGLPCGFVPFRFSNQNFVCISYLLWQRYDFFSCYEVQIKSVVHTAFYEIRARSACRVKLARAWYCLVPELRMRRALPPPPPTHSRHGVRLYQDQFCKHSPSQGF
jgi:hypothetical protein